MANRDLTNLQKEFLAAFFKREDRFCLTGGAALVGFYLGHRETHDLDLFTLEDVMSEGSAVVADTARELSATLEPIQTSPDFRRILLRHEDESLIIDLIRERVAQYVPEKPVINGIRVDPPEEIISNKLCALLSRSEIRDLVDLRALENAGYRMEDAIVAASMKDSGFTPALLAWVLEQIELGDDLNPPGGVSVSALRSYLDDLKSRLTRLAFP